MREERGDENCKKEEEENYVKGELEENRCFEDKNIRKLTFCFD
jgi:hypothetical protein